jgi:hypothetical protein
MIGRVGTCKVLVTWVIATDGGKSRHLQGLQQSLRCMLRLVSAAFQLLLSATWSVMSGFELQGMLVTRQYAY